MQKYFFIFFIVFKFSLSGDITFFIGSDLHFGRSKEKNIEYIKDMNNLPETKYPSLVSGVVKKPLGVILIGDLTNKGRLEEWFGPWVRVFSDYRNLGFLALYGLNGENLLKYPVFEGFGNHDHKRNSTIIKERIKHRNLHRMEKINISKERLHYSWNWENVHFIHLNEYPGYSKEAENSLKFLKEDLKNNLKSFDTPIIIFHHFGFDEHSSTWWKEDERKAYYEVIKNYNVIAIFNGHSHTIEHSKWKGIDVFNDGTLLSGQYFVCHISDNHLFVFERKKGKWGKFSFTKDFNLSTLNIKTPKSL
ncbi:MAG: metallophosphoesterase [Chlamydiae bacterium]|nr:metallophosphoesterase [Chlamydiota bacterium]